MLSCWFGLSLDDGGPRTTHSIIPSWKAMKKVSSKPSEEARVRPVISPKRSCPSRSENEPSNVTGGVLCSSAEDEVPNL